MSEVPKKIISNLDTRCQKIPAPQNQVTALPPTWTPGAQVAGSHKGRTRGSSLFSRAKGLQRVFVLGRTYSKNNCCSIPSSLDPECPSGILG